MGEGAAQEAIEHESSGQPEQYHGIQHGRRAAFGLAGPLADDSKTGQSDQKPGPDDTVRQHHTGLSARHGPRMGPAQQSGNDAAHGARPNEEADGIGASRKTACKKERLRERRGQDQRNGEMHRNRVENAQARHGPFEGRRSPVLAPVGMPRWRWGRGRRMIMRFFMPGRFAVMRMSRLAHLPGRRFGLDMRGRMGFVRRHIGPGLFCCRRFMLCRRMAPTRCRKTDRCKSSQHRHQGNSSSGHTYLHLVWWRYARRHDFPQPSRTDLRRRELVMTETEERLMAAAAIIGDSMIPKTG